MTTALYFDLDGTLLSYTEAFDDMVAAVLPCKATQPMLDTYTEAVLGEIDEMTESPFEHAFGTVCREYGIDADPSTLAAEYRNREAAATAVPPAVRDLVTHLADRHPVGILTNGDGPMQRRKVEAHGLDDLVDTVLVSNELGVRKPDPAIFDIARERLPADRHVYIGDTYEEDIVPAADCGFLTAYVGNDVGPAATVSAAATADLATFLAALLDGAVTDDSA
jgi:putative hydrolase of the HAD superfamily